MGSGASLSPGSGQGAGTPLNYLQSGGTPSYGTGTFGIMQSIAGRLPGGAQMWNQGWNNLPQSSRQSIVPGNPPPASSSPLTSNPPGIGPSTGANGNMVVGSAPWSGQGTSQPPFASRFFRPQQSSPWASNGGFGANNSIQSILSALRR